jgi:phage-related protein
MSWHITFYSKRVEVGVLALPKGLLASFIHVVELIEEYGPQIGMPYTRSMGSGLFEIREKGKEGIARVFYCALAGKELVMLNVFVKKTQKTQKKEMAVARKRMKEVLK